MNSFINENSTKPIYIEIYHDDILLGTATGFEVQYYNKHLITNWHVVSGRNFITKECLDKNCSLPNNLIITFKKYLADDKEEWIKEKIELYDEYGEHLWVEHPNYGSRVDVVAIPFDKNSNYLTYKESFNINTEYNVNVTDNLYILGFPFGYFIKSKEEPHAVWISGKVASDPILDININEENLPAFLIDSRTRQGQSGSPVIYYERSGLDVNGITGDMTIWGGPFMKEVGIYSGRINSDSDIGYVWKWKVIKEILESKYKKNG